MYGVLYTVILNSHQTSLTFLLSFTYMQMMPCTGREHLRRRPQGSKRVFPVSTDHQQTKTAMVQIKASTPSTRYAWNTWYLVASSAFHLVTLKSMYLSCLMSDFSILIAMMR